ncbi:hypothetical protein [Nakamurella lactea]|uniref:hypothetical protein n=1 Tax=Nakamurella lactea TaxID=459515 RepID=UPI0012B5FBA1|nr:hypothetical protein [Nakamurella lactea]
MSERPPDGPMTPPVAPTEPGTTAPAVPVAGSEQDGDDGDRTQRIPATPATPPPGGPDDPEKRRVTPIAHPPVTLPPNPPAQRKAGLNEVIIAVTGILTLVSTFLAWVTHDFGGWSSAWSTGLWPAGVLGFVAAGFHLVRMLPPADKAMGALVPMLLSTAAVWIPIAALPDNGNAWGIWLCLIPGIILTGSLIIAAMSDPALRRADDPNDLFN